MLPYAGVVLSRGHLAKAVSCHAPGLDETEAARLIDIVVSEIAAALRGHGDVIVPSLARFRLKRRAAHRFRHPTTGEEGIAPAKTVVTAKLTEVFLRKVIDDA